MASNEGQTLPAKPAGAYWIEPSTCHAYPVSFPEYRRKRESEEKPPPRHRSLGPDIDYYLWRYRQSPAAPPVEIRLIFRAGAPPRVQRIVAEILRAIRRGQPAAEAIRHVARRFGLRQTRARTFIKGSLGFETLPRRDVGPGWAGDL